MNGIILVNSDPA